MSATLDFLRLILPESGYYCAVTIVNNQWRHKFFDDIEAMSQYILKEDARGREVYHACGAYTEGVMDPHDTPKHLRTRGRTHTNVRALRSLWLDIDCGEGKPYANQLDAYNAVEALYGVNGGFTSSSLPKPLFVNSGYGLHLYWPLVKDISKTEFDALSTGLTLLCEHHGLKIDPARACDPSSVLRPVGSHNHKRGGCKEVNWSGPVGPYEIGEFDGLQGSIEESRANRTRIAFQSFGSQGNLSNTALLNLYGPSTARAEEIAEQCGQVSRLRDADGSLTEPEWYAILGVLAYCEDGRRFAHTWGANFKQYTFDGTEAKFEQRKNSAGPTTCEHFNSLDKRCRECKLWGEITSPIQISGRKILCDTTSDRNYSNNRTDKLDSDVWPISESSLSTMGSFELRYDGLRSKSEDKKGELTDKPICSQPFWLTAINEGENGGKFSYGFEWDLPNNSLRSFILDARIFHSSSGLAEFQGQGPIIHEADLFRKFVREEIDDWHRENKVSIRYDQLGWKDGFDAFLVGNKLYEKGNIVRIIQPSTDITYKSKDLGPKKGGSLVEWSRAANELYTSGLEAHSFALLASFASPLMSCHVESEGGAVIAMVSNQSGTGKSTVLDAVASVWGNRSALEMTNRDTEISRAISLGVLHNLPVVLDELRFRDPETTRDFITMFTVGKDKTRANRDGTLQQNNYRWQTILVGGSNYSLVDLLETDATNALALRVFEFSADAQFIDKKKGDALRRELVRNAGWAGDAYVKALLQPGNIEFIQQTIPKWSSEIYDVCKLQREHRFWVRTTVSILIAAVIVRQLGILEFSVERIREWILQKLSSKVRGSQGISDQTPSTVLGSFLSQHALDTLTVSGPAGRGASVVQVIREERRNLYIRAEESSGLLYIDRDIYKKWLYKHGFNREENIEELKRIGVITKECTKTLGAGTGKASANRPAYEINARHPDILGYVYEGWETSSKIIPIRRER